MAADKILDLYEWIQGKPEFPGINEIYDAYVVYYLREKAARTDHRQILERASLHHAADRLEALTNPATMAAELNQPASVRQSVQDCPGNGHPCICGNVLEQDVAK